jgi:hypothetical protein
MVGAAPLLVREVNHIAFTLLSVPGTGGESAMNASGRCNAVQRGEGVRSRLSGGSFMRSPRQWRIESRIAMERLPR